jgi:hypothetical protein
MISVQTDNSPAYVRQVAFWVAYLLGEMRRKVNSVSVATTAAPREAYLVNASGGARTITLPFAKDANGQLVTVKKTDASANAVTVAAQSGETIDGSASTSLASQWARVTVISNGTAWFIV